MDESEVTHGPESSAALRHMAKRAVDDPSFLAGALSAFAGTISMRLGLPRTLAAALRICHGWHCVADQPTES